MDNEKSGVISDIKQSGVMKLAVIGSVITALILIIGTFWSGKSASEDTEKAVHNVSLLYLEELAGRREQVVASTLSGYITSMDVALGLLERDDLSSVENLQAYQARMKQFYGLEKFAFVDEDGLIYTSRGTRTDIAQYDFDYENLSAPEIFLKNLDTNNIRLIVAAPVDRVPFNNKNLIVCFMEIDMSKMLSNISLQSTGNNTTFCNLYINDGTPLTNIVLGGLSNEKNLLKAMENANFETGSSFGAMRADFEALRTGVISFIYNDIKETMCYVPVQGTNWMLTYLVRESIIAEQVNSISAGIVQRNLFQLILTALVLMTIFGIMILQMRRTAKLNLEKEISETENRVKQQELEEQLALQEELLSQEQLKTQQDNMITALSADYRSVYYIDLDIDEGICYREDSKIEHTKTEGEKFKFSETFTNYANKCVTEEYREGFLDFVNAENIRAGLLQNAVIVYRYLVKHGDKEIYEMLRIAGVRHSEERTDNQVHKVGAGFTDIDEEMRDALAKNEALNNALKTAEEASTAKTVFLSNMSHEIRTPMNAIIGLDNLAMNVPDTPEKVQDYLKKIDSSAQHLLGLINDILDMSRIESGRLTIKNEEFAFSDLIEQLNIMFSGQCAERKIQYNCRINGEVEDFYIGDVMKLKQIFINILGNAAKFTPAGGEIDFIVEKTANFGGKSTFKFTVKDTGVGMSKEFLPKIFETFSQENSGAANKYGSSGLGMAITKNIVEMMNGNISVESEKGVGTTFFVTVTLTDAKKKISTDDIEINPMSMNVLIIDDDPIACDHAKLVLEKTGIAAEIAHSGKEALEMVKLKSARREPYNLIIVDWQMPEMDGVEVTRQIRSVIGDETAIIILTAYNWDDIAEEAIKAGVDSFIAKPLFSGHLLDEFKNALKKKKALAAITQKKADLTGKKVLLAEDMIVNAEIMMEVLKMREMEPEHAENGRIALEMFEKSPVNYYAAILMDMRMPEMDGLEATIAIRKLNRPDASTIPIIALTANAFDEDVQRSLQSGLNAHLSKPVNPDILFDTLENLIQD